MKKTDDLPILAFASQQDWEAWLEVHQATDRGLWLKIAKKDAGVLSLSYQEALESALCYGWIDGQKASFDEQSWLQRFTPRSARSGWSKINCDKIAELLAAGRMREAGLRQVEVARADGRWQAAYESQRNMTVPDDFQQALEKNEQAKAFFETLNRANRYAILYRIQIAKRPETRSARITTFIEMLSRQQQIYP